MFMKPIKVTIPFFGRKHTCDNYPDLMKKCSLRPLFDCLIALRLEIREPVTYDCFGGYDGPLRFYDANSKAPDGFYVNSNVYFWLVDQFIRGRGITGDLTDDIIIRALGTEDEAWTGGYNEERGVTYSRKFTFLPEVIVAMDTEIDRIEAAVQTADAAADTALEQAAREEAEWKCQKADELDGVTWDVRKETIYDEGGKTAMYTHRIAFDGHVYTLIERNIFDFGRVINFKHRPGLVVRKDRDDPALYIDDPEIDKCDWHRLDDAEAKAYRIVNKYGKFADCEIRM